MWLDRAFLGACAAIMLAQTPMSATAAGGASPSPIRAPPVALQVWLLNPTSIWTAVGDW